MTEAKRRSFWEPFSMAMTIYANSQRDPKKSKPFKLEDFFPFAIAEKAKKRKKDLPKGQITDLVHLFKNGVKNAPVNVSQVPGG